MPSSTTTLPPVLDASAPTLSAAEFLTRRNCRLVYWRNDYLSWTGTRYERRDHLEIEREIYDFGDAAATTSGGPFRPTKKKVEEILAAVRVRTLVPERFDPGCDIATGQMTAGSGVAFENGMLDLATGTLTPHSDRWLTLNNLPFAYEPNLPAPQQWLQFLKSLWPDDDGQEGGAVAALQEVLGYLVSGRTDMQKIFLLVGPPRSGKGTLAWVIERLIGSQNYVGIQFAQLGQQFGLQVLIGKTVMMIPDARTYSRDLGAATERLLTISGEDVIAVPRKRIGDWTGALSTRIVILSNEIPRFHDTSGAIATRFVPIRMTESFLGREDVDLKKKLLAELPAILLWALKGARRLYERGQFIIPATSADMIQEVAEGAAPLRVFVRERLIWADPEAAMLSKQQLFDAYRRWCADNGHHSMAQNIFAQRLRELLPDLQEGRHRGQPRGWLGMALRRDDDDDVPSALDGKPVVSSPVAPRSTISASLFESILV